MHQSATSKEQKKPFLLRANGSGSDLQFQKTTHEERRWDPATTIRRLNRSVQKLILQPGNVKRSERGRPSREAAALAMLRHGAIPFQSAPSRCLVLVVDMNRNLRQSSDGWFAASESVNCPIYSHQLNLSYPASESLSEIKLSYGAAWTSLLGVNLPWRLLSSGMLRM